MPRVSSFSPVIHRRALNETSFIRSHATCLDKMSRGILVGTEEHSRVSQLREHIQHIQGAIQVITQELQARRPRAEEDDDEFEWMSKPSKKRRNGAQPWDVRMRDTVHELEQIMDVLRGREVVRECEEKIADLTLVAEKATAEASQQQVKLAALQKELEERDCNWHAGK
ncbi:hypothetical protein KVT40_001815 [Elsinoe batatas]|uniref:Uncharacterized protein n=1 Tax=Elsinoe batatas TaxID=2601811 RepID=A0A8K0PHM1_9PEZI|nr:hypothetical protein KVT40_001815 [Elsinoe batatas]